MQTKHPRILNFEWTGETDVAGNKVIYLVTEQVHPLPVLLEELELKDEQRLMFLALALRQAAQAVAFLNNQCKLMHGNVCTSTFLMTPELDLRLGFFDMASEHAHLTSSLLARYE
jgi:SCY1-like protein 1